MRMEIEEKLQKYLNCLNRWGFHIDKNNLITDLSQNYIKMLYKSFETLFKNNLIKMRKHFLLYSYDQKRYVNDSEVAFEIVNIPWKLMKVKLIDFASDSIFKE